MPLKGRVKAAKISVGTTAVELYISGKSRRTISIKNNSSTVVYIGGKNVTAAQGYPLANRETMDVDLADEAHIYGITESGTAEVRILEVD